MQMMRAACARCSGVFDVCSLPMPAEAAIEATQARSICPWCGNRKGNVMASPRDLDEGERAIKTVAIGKEASWRSP